jgi:hypothetical protein
MGMMESKSGRRRTVLKYTQVKVSIAFEVAAAFKTACVMNGVSMASVLSSHMAKYAKVGIEAKNRADPFGTRKKRRRVLCEILLLMGQLLAAEERYRDNIPANLQNSTVYSNVDWVIGKIDDIIDLLKYVYE